MKKGVGFFIALVAAAAGAAIAVFVIKKREELEQYDYDEFDEDFFNDCDCDKGDCDCDDCDDCDCEDCDCENEDCDLEDDIESPLTIDEEVALNSVEDEIEDNEMPLKSDF